MVVAHKKSNFEVKMVKCVIELSDESYFSKEKYWGLGVLQDCI